MLDKCSLVLYPNGRTGSTFESALTAQESQMSRDSQVALRSSAPPSSDARSVGEARDLTSDERAEFLEDIKDRKGISFAEFKKKNAHRFK